MKTWLRALRFFQPELKRTVFAFLLLVVSIGAGVLKPWPLALIIDSLLGSEPLPNWIPRITGPDRQHQLLWLCVAILVLHIAQGAFAATANLAAIRAGLMGLRRVRNFLFHRMQKLSMRFYQEHDVGDLIHRASWDTYSFQTLFQQGLFNLVTALLSLALMVIVMWQLNSWLTIVTFGVFPLMVISMLFFGRGMQTRSAAAHQADSKVTSLFQQNIAALQLVLANTREAFEQKRFDEQTDLSLRKKTSQHTWELLYGLAVALVFGLGSGAIAWAGAHQVINGELTVGELLIFFSYLGQIYDPLNQISRVGATVSDASAGAQRVLEILDATPDVANTANARVVATSQDDPAARQIERVQIRGGLEFEDVTFGYREGQKALDNVSLSIAPGESIAIIGPSGSGKSTLLQLVLRFYDPVRGTIRADGFDLRDLQVQGWRANISLVLQEPLLLAATVAENIAYGKPDASREQIVAAARQAQAFEFIDRLPEKFETVIGESAARLSVGERQRLNLARAFLRDAPILILDEPTSALDAESEEAVMDSLDRLMSNRTTLIVAHRLSTIRNVDRIVVLEQGRITEIGTPDELLGQPGYYARLVKAAHGTP